MFSLRDNTFLGGEFLAENGLLVGYNYSERRKYTGHDKYNLIFFKSRLSAPQVF